MKNDIVTGLAVLLVVFIVCACVQGRMLNTKAKRVAELRRQHERQIDRKVNLTRKYKRFDCPRCGSTVPCEGCLRR